MDGAKPAEVASQVEKLASAPASAVPAKEVGLKELMIFIAAGLGQSPSEARQRGSSNAVHKGIVRPAQVWWGFCFPIADRILFCELFKLFAQASHTGFSREIVGLLKEQGVEFRSFDILSDEEVGTRFESQMAYPTPDLHLPLTRRCDRA